MSLVTLVVVVALLAGWAAGGGLDGMARLHPRGVRLLVAAFTVTVVATVVDRFQVLGVVVAALLAVRFTQRNRHLPGMPLVGVGLAANTLVILVNGAMPVSVDAAARAGVPPERLRFTDGRHELLTDDTRLAFLGDVVPVAVPLHTEAASPGDVAVAAGLGLLVFGGLLRSPHSRAARVGGTPSPGRPGRSPTWDHGRTAGRSSRHGEEVTQAPRPRQAQGQPRQASQRLSGSRASRPTRGPSGFA